MIPPIFEQAWGDSGYFFKGYTEEYLKKLNLNERWSVIVTNKKCQYFLMFPQYSLQTFGRTF